MAQQDLHEACTTGDLEAVKRLANKDNINKRNRKGLTPLYLAAYSGRCGCVKSLLQTGADPTLVTPQGTSPLHAACDHGWAHVVSALLSHKPAPGVNARTNSGTTALYFACPSDDSPVEESPRSSSSSDPAGRPDYPKCIRLLLKSRADPNIAQDDGWRPIHAASYFTGNPSIVKLLLAHGADADAGIPEGSTPLHLAAQEGKAAALKHLLQSTADVNKQKRDGATALYMAAKSGHEPCVKVLLINGADPALTLIGSSGRTSLHIASELGHAQCVRQLLKHGATFDKSERRSPLELAKENGHKEVCRILEEKPAGDTKSSGGGVFTCCVRGADDDSSPSRPPSAVPNPRSAVNSLEMEQSGEFTGKRRSKLGRKKCAYFESCKEFLAWLDLSELYFDKSHDVCFCRSCHEGRGDNLYYTRGEPPKDYGLPVGWVKFGLKAPTKAFAENAFQLWHVAFHGTSKDSVKKILKTGELLMPGDITPEGTELRPPTTHFDDRRPGNAPPPGHDISKIYLSPSIKYSACDVYSPSYLWTRHSSKRMMRIKVAFQVRVQPHTYQVGAQTIGAKVQIDPKFPNSQLEWSTKRRGVTVLIGILVSMTGPGVDGGEDNMGRGGFSDLEPAITQTTFKD